MRPQTSIPRICEYCGKPFLQTLHREKTRRFCRSACSRLFGTRHTDSKPCSKCGEIKPLSQFGHDPAFKSGYTAKCQACLNEKAKGFRAKVRVASGPNLYQQRRADRNALLANGLRICIKCKRTLAVTSFGKTEHEPDGFETRCRECMHRFYLDRRDEILARYDPKAAAIKNRYQRHKRQAADPVGYLLQEMARSAIRRARILEAGVEPIDPKFILERESMRCHICGHKVQLKDLTFDHLIPVSKKGPTAEWNLAVAHRSCNSSRGAGRTPAQLRLPLH